MEEQHVNISAYPAMHSAGSLQRDPHGVLCIGESSTTVSTNHVDSTLCGLHYSSVVSSGDSPLLGFVFAFVPEN